MKWMFQKCSALTSIDVSSFDTSKVTNMSYMFSECSLLTTIYASNNFVTSAIPYAAASEDMFKDCTNLVGSSGTTYNSSKVDKTYAHIDGGTSNPGYFTAAP